MGINILFADDSATIRKVVELAFDNNDINVTTVTDGFEVLEQLESSSPDIVVADIDMPGFNGLEVCRHIKDSEELQSIPVLLIKSQSDEVDDATLKELNADGCIDKPFKSEELIKKVREVLGLQEEENSDTEESQEQEQEQEQENVSEGTESDLFSDGTLSNDDELLPLTQEVELIGSEPRFSPSPSVVEVFSSEKTLEEEDQDLSGIMTEQDIQEGKEEVEKRNKELDEFFGNDDDVDWDNLDGTDVALEKFSMNFFKGSENKEKADLDTAKEQLDPEMLTNLITEEKLDRVLQSVFEKVGSDVNEKVVREQLTKFLEELSPKIIGAIERIIWEIVPDLAESLIKKEIEKIKNG